MDVIPEILKNVIEDISSLPGYGEKSAQRFAVNLLKMPRKDAINIIKDLSLMLEKIHPCKECGIFSEEEICPICNSEERDKSIICVVEESFDAFAIEKTGKYNGLYHILGGRLSPLEGITEEDLNISSLLQRVEKLKIKEILLATNPTVEGEATALYIANLLKNKDITISRLAYGLPFGAILENADEFTLTKAIELKVKI
ncbi:recombination mediator RecR [Venenivibrio stagnispumantis]|uniref:Recombination protein RecR n=1 Tax=Venenivibrio stagnispumantis TaxID=407998 RepID=A0AA45WIP5_9AQUI|nr:recombination mediator RecR [Venenivibrio stagnispumantis]MCW4572643.1 recombination mediator RecR [Venenivibrio stagnispumantis]SMP00725.1 DNA replication and repair protein RecR [Venenivibrio stagnispumantis]